MQNYCAIEKKIAANINSCFLVSLLYLKIPKIIMSWKDNLN